MVGFLNSIASSVTEPEEVRELVEPKHPRDPMLAQMFGDPDGVAVNAQSAMRVTAVYACVALISETIAALPLHVYKKSVTATGGTSQSKMVDHPLYGVLHDMPVAGMTSFEWREMQISHTALRGDSYARIVLGRDGRVRELPPILPDHIEPFRNRNGRLQYRWWEDGAGPVRVLFDDEVLRIPHKMLDGVRSLSPIATHRQTIGNALSANRFLRSFYQNSAQPKGALMVPEALSPDAVAALRDSWNKRHKGPENAGKIAVFDGGMKWEQIGMTMDDAQYLELQKFSVGDIARIFLVPPHKVGEMGAATFSNIEHQAIEFVVDTILRWVRRIEMRFNSYLLSAADRASGVSIGLDMKGLLRGDASARSAFYRAMFYIGAMNPNEIRQAEDMNPYDGGNEFFVQGATVPIDSLGGLENVPGIDGTVQEMIDQAVQKALETEQRRAQKHA